MVTIQKRTKRKGSRIQVTFAMPAIEGCGCLYLEPVMHFTRPER